MHALKAPPSWMCTQLLPGQPEVIIQVSLRGKKNARCMSAKLVH